VVTGFVRYVFQIGAPNTYLLVVMEFTYVVTLLNLFIAEGCISLSLELLYHP
jgi:hypothetical protein